MDRKEIIKNLKKITCELAQKYNCPILNKGEDRQKGVWGEEVTKFLEGEYGECTEEIIFSSEETIKKEYWEKPQRKVWFRYRFATPCIAIEYYDDNKEQIFAEIEIENNGDVGQFTIFNEKGMELAQELLNEWDKVRQKEKMNE